MVRSHGKWTEGATGISFPHRTGSSLPVGGGAVTVRCVAQAISGTPVSVTRAAPLLVAYGA